MSQNQRRSLIPRLLWRHTLGSVRAAAPPAGAFFGLNGMVGFATFYKRRLIWLRIQQGLYSRVGSFSDKWQQEGLLLR